MTVARLPSNFKQERGDRFMAERYGNSGASFWNVCKSNDEIGFMAERYGNSGARAMRFLPVEKKVV